MTTFNNDELKQLKATVPGSDSTRHNQAKAPAPDDPMAIKAAVIEGDERLMMECLIEEFAHLGWSGQKIARMFQQPFFLAAHGLEKRFGRQTVLDCIEHTLARCGVFHFEIEEPSARCKEPSAGQKEPSAHYRASAVGEIPIIQITDS